MLYYQDDHITLYHGDCREIAPTLGRFDLLLTDPPYECEAHTAMRRTRATLEGRRDADAMTFDAMTDDLRAFICSIECNWQVVFCQAEAVAKYQQLYGEAYRRPMVWIKPDSAPQFTGDRPAMGYESIVCAWKGEGKSRWNGGGKRGVYIFNSTSGRTGGHPTEKPEPLIRQLIKDFSLEGPVLDLCAGIGTTGRAAKDLGLHCTMIEREERYCEIAAKRMAQEVLF
jgi:site-specific DNA-methyltransferase (adenine-specific)